MKTRRAPSTPRMISAEELSRLDATPERLARARESGQASERIERVRRLSDPFDVMRANRVLAPHDSRLNDIRWLIGDALRRLHQRASLNSLRTIDLERVGSTGFGPRSGLPESEMALHERDKLRAAEQMAGVPAWPILERVVIQGGGVRDCRTLIVEVQTDWRADAISCDRLRVSLDALGGLLGVTARGR